MDNKPGQRPPMAVSNEADEGQLELARAQGDALWRAIEAMKIETHHHFHHTTAGEYIVACAVEAAEGMYEFKGEKQLEWGEPDRENAHIEIVVCDASDRRFVPGLDVTLTVVDERGAIVGTHRQPYLWHPWLYHYGRNWTLPGDGRYTFRIAIAPPRYARHDKRNGKRFKETVTVQFEGVEIATGQKHS
jgi:hypothetical protein